MRNPMRNLEILWNPRTSFVVPRGRPRGATGEGLRGIAGPHPGATNQPQPGGHQSRGPWGATPGHPGGRRERPRN